MQACRATAEFLRISLQRSLFLNVTQCSVGTFNKLTGKDLWKSASPQSKRTGRGKRGTIRKKEDFSRDHILGEGKAGIQWPGLNLPRTMPAYQRSEKEQDEYNTERKMRLEGRKGFLKAKVKGWTGAHYGGVRLGYPEPIAGQKFEDFESIVMDVARVSHMNRKVGRVYSMRATVAVGNGKGLIGVGASASSDVSTAFRVARSRAMNRLNYVERLEGRTVYEDIYVNHHRTWLTIRKQPEGYGLRGHRALQDMCKLIGFKDVYIKVTGSTTTLNLLKCFIKGMLAQETYQEKADRLGYHLVEFDELRHNYPLVLASPSQVKTTPHDDYEEYMSQELIIRDVHRAENPLHPINKVIATNNRGPPVPASRSVPAFLADLRDVKVE